MSIGKTRMSNTYFQFKQFAIQQEKAGMKVTTDSCLFGAWVAQQISYQPAKNILDIGTGTGLLSLMIAQQNKLLIDAIEIEEEAYVQAKENCTASPWKDSVTVLQQDVFTYSPGKLYDAIVCNPPFYEKELGGKDKQKNIAQHNRDFSLSQLLSFIRKNLQEQGLFYLLLPYKREKEVVALVKDQGLFLTQKINVKPSVAHEYFRIMLAGTKEPQELQIKELSICEADKKTYTAAFTQLLQDYYLYL